MKLNIPFYENNRDATRCFQVGMKIALKHFLGKEFPLEKLDELTGRKDQYWTWTPQIVPILYDLGLEVKEYDGIDVKLFLQGEEFIRKQYPKADADIIIEKTDMPVLIKSLKEAIKYDLFEKKNLSLEEFKKEVDEGHLLLVVLDASKLHERDKPFQGHMVAVTGYDDEFIYYHESGPAAPNPNEKTKINTFMNAADFGGEDQAIIVIYGKR